MAQTLTPEEQADFDRQFAELEVKKKISGEWKGETRIRNLSVREAELEEKESELFGETATNEGEAELYQLLDTHNKDKRIEAIRLRAFLTKAWFQMFEAAKYTTEMHFGAVICILKDEAAEEEIREKAVIYYEFIENAKKIVKRPDSNDNFWLLIKKVRMRWEREVKVNWRRVVTIEISKMQAP